MFKTICLLVFAIVLTTSYVYNPNLRYDGGFTMTPYSTTYIALQPDLEEFIKTFETNDGIIIIDMPDFVNRWIQKFNGFVMTLKPTFDGQIIVSDSLTARTSLTEYF